MFGLNLRQFLLKTVSRCQGNCGKKITQNDGMLIKTYGTTTQTDKKTRKEMSKYEPMYIHFNKTYLKRHANKQPDEKFDFLLADETRNNLSDEEKYFLTELGIKF